MKAEQLEQVLRKVRVLIELNGAGEVLGLAGAWQTPDLVQEFWGQIQDFFFGSGTPEIICQYLPMSEESLRLKDYLWQLKMQQDHLY